MVSMVADHTVSDTDQSVMDHPSFYMISGFKKLLPKKLRFEDVFNVLGNY